MLKTENENDFKENFCSETAEKKSVNKAPNTEINLLEYICLFLRYKCLIVGICSFGLITGYITAVIKGPTYISEAVIVSREREGAQGAMQNLSSFGPFGTMVASQFNMAENPGLDKMKLIINSRVFNSELIEKFDLLPDLYRQKFPKKLEDSYIPETNQWMPDFENPDMMSMGDLLREEFLHLETKTNGTMEIQVRSKDSLFSSNLMNAYLVYLNSYIQKSVVEEAEGNVEFLRARMAGVADPLLRDKLLELIATEMEKSMLVSREAFRVIDSQFDYVMHREKLLYPVLFAGIGLFLSIFTLVSSHALFGGDLSETEKKLVADIKREMRKLF
ncbi:hypothetical protein CHISP_1105 [Chitinispirillum alkaliphilum]|nr:hypothetical protein CHISP_1105 [Chitinispirillum alkaliphilum]